MFTMELCTGNEAESQRVSVTGKSRFLHGKRLCKEKHAADEVVNSSCLRMLPLPVYLTSSPGSHQAHRDLPRLTVNRLQ